MSDEDEAAEMEDEAVKSRVQHKPKVRGEAVGGGQPGGPPPSSPSITWWDVRLVSVLGGCHSDPLPPSLCLFPSLCVWVSGSLSAHLPQPLTLTWASPWPPGGQAQASEGALRYGHLLQEHSFPGLLQCYLSNYREKMADSKRNLAKNPSESKADKAKQFAIPLRAWHSLEGQRELGALIRVIAAAILT